MRQAIQDGAVYFGKLVAVAMLIWAAILTPVTVLAQGPAGGSRSCIIDFERFAINAWTRYDACIIGTNYHTAWSKITNRTGCRFEYLSDTAQAYADYASCMSLGRLWGK